ncbi:histone deacetylase family protein [Blastopirellula retiformator]|uniref:Histone deacetylase-like amidohydrolase n=1 Tax=Blastopirellula retiformator TaxID=2527970 RepID=A0A5C5UWM9_9BACT|nr:histone deacetylase [Blastopirellula retiformator]TWT30751.1 Histone deacetylase-like amidohydrolase [Blastopirellula retiformator]
MTLLYSDHEFLEHETGHHPESAQRLVAVTERLEKSGLIDQCRRPEWGHATSAEIQLVHTAAMRTSVEGFSLKGGGRIEVDTAVSHDSYHVATRAVGAAIEATRRVLAGEAKNALALVRPPGHHATPTMPMGFCLFNNAAIAAQYALTNLDVDRVLIIDWDVHHGNGTQDAFWESERVGFLSSHRFPFYPGTGDSMEIGQGVGLGYTRNLPLKFGIERRDFITKFAQALEEFTAKVQPQLILLSAGFDAHAADPVGNLGLESEDFGELSQIVLDAAAAYSGGKLVSLLEGGYNPDKLAESVEIHLRKLLSHDKTSGP